MILSQPNRKVLQDTVFSVVQNGFAGKRICIPNENKNGKMGKICINKSWIANMIYKEFIRKLKSKGGKI